MISTSFLSSLAGRQGSHPRRLSLHPRLAPPPRLLRRAGDISKHQRVS